MAHPSYVPIQSLPWLPRAPRPLREELATLPIDPLSALRAMQVLARQGRDEAELRMLGARIRRLLKDAPEGFAGDVRRQGFIPVRLLVLSISTASHLADALIGTALRFGLLLAVTIAEYEEPEAWLQRNADVLKASRPDFVLLASDSQMIPLAAPLGDLEASKQAIDAALDRVRGISAAAVAITGRPVIVQTLAGDPAKSQINMDLGLAGSPRHLVGEFNRRLAGEDRPASCLLFDVGAIADLVGQSTWSPGRFWYVAKYPFATSMIPLYADHVMRILAAQLGRSRRVLVLDLDNTMWGGVVGDDGIEGLELGTGTPLGEAHAAVQRTALSWKERGVILCVSSKNDEAIALDAFRRHPEMILKEEDIVAWRVNWEDKAANIKAIAGAIDLGLESFVFVDDNPAERKRVRDALPVVAVPELPLDPSEWPSIIQAAGYFEHLGFSREDRVRTSLYKANARRAAQLERIGNYDDFLSSLSMTLTIAPFEPIGRKRVAQLIAKSNQFNLTTPRYGEARIAELEADPGVLTVQARLEDAFGDNGMISVVICHRRKNVLEVDAWIMSCRVLGRRVEEAILQYLIHQARGAGIQEIVGRFVPTERNGLVRDHFKKLGFSQTDMKESGETFWSLLVDDYKDKEFPTKVWVRANLAEKA